MKYVRMLLLVLAAAVFVAPAAQAQGGGGGGMGRGGRGMMAALFKDITLTDAQQTKIDSIAAAYREKMPRMARGETPDPDAMAKRREMTQQQYADFRKVLTDDQQKVFDENVKNLPQGRGRGGSL
jgi:Spy/CpxP family protein refolding chaperone